MRFEPNGKIKIFIAKQTINDYTENTKNKTFFNPVVAPALISQMGDSQLYWKTGGTVADHSFFVLLDQRYKNLITQSNYIEINGITCYGYRGNTNKLKMKEMDEYLELYVWSKQ